MKPHNHGAIVRRLLLSLMVVVCAFTLPDVRAAAPVAANGGTLPTGEHSDQVAWQHFASVVAPAGRALVQFETWAADEDIYTATPAWPDPATRGEKRMQQSVLRRMNMPHALSINGDIDGSCVAAGDPQAANFPTQVLPPAQQPCFAEEVRRNLASFRYIVQNKLNTQAGLAAAYQKAQTGWRVSLPEDSVEVKADWVPVEVMIAWLKRNGVRLTGAQVRAQFYTTVSQGMSFALVALHISSKELPNWVWATFEHRLNPGRCDTMGCNDRFGSTLRRVAPRSTPNTQYPACAKTPALRQLFAGKQLANAWNNYCLKASEIAFVAPNGAPLMNGNSFTERVAAGVAIKRSSCIACHASAGFTREGLPYTKLLGMNPMGTVKLPSDIVANDFIWGILAIKQASGDQVTAANGPGRSRVAARR